MAIIQTLDAFVQSYPAGLDSVTDLQLSQNENGRQIRFTIGGVTIPENSVATISGTKPDGVVYSNTGTIEGANTIIFDEDVQMTAVFGTWYAKIRVINDGNTIASARVRFIIDKDPVDAGAVPSDSQLDGLVAEAEAYAEAAEDSAERASVTYGSPLTASTAAAMIDVNRVYVYTGAESDYTYGDWYYYNGSAWVDGGVYNSAAVETDTTLTESGVPADAKATGDKITALENTVSEILNAEGLHKYGVSGIGQSASSLTRIWDSVGMTAQVGTDGDNTNVVNNFDDVTPFNRRKCVGHWVLHDGRPQFIVNAYQGDADYAEDGTKGDYVAVECPRAYYYLHGDTLGVSAHHYSGWKPFDIFCHGHNGEETVEFAYLPAYALAKKDGHAVSLPGLDNEQGDYETLFKAARTYDNDNVKAKAMLEPWAVNFYEWALYTVEFAKQVPTDVMKGCESLRSDNSDTCEFTDTTHILTNNYYASRVVGEYICVYGGNASHTNVAYQATHKILSITRCDGTGTADASGTHQLIEVEDLEKGYFTYATGTTYNLAARPYRTGACNTVSTPSGSPVSYSDGYHPMKYRHRENIFGNQYTTIVDLFNKRVGTGDSDYKLEWYYLPDPSVITTPANNISLPDSNYVKLNVETPHDNYVNGYIKTRQYADEYPDIWIPGVTTGASISTYYAVYAALVNSYVVRSVRFGGDWYNGTVYRHGYYAPSSANAFSGGHLCFAP